MTSACMNVKLSFPNTFQVERERTNEKITSNMPARHRNTLPVCTHMNRPTNTSDPIARHTSKMRPENIRASRVSKPPQKTSVSVSSSSTHFAMRFSILGIHPLGVAIPVDPACLNNVWYVLRCVGSSCDRLSNPGRGPPIGMKIWAQSALPLTKSVLVPRNGCSIPFISGFLSISFSSSGSSVPVVSMMVRGAMQPPFATLPASTRTCVLAYLRQWAETMACTSAPSAFIIWMFLAVRMSPERLSKISTSRCRSTSSVNGSTTLTVVGRTTLLGSSLMFPRAQSTVISNALFTPASYESRALFPSKMAK
mmetsp:Transcript_55158/g.130956  ORF Transcript_55158/g.130956 Transcript_55158/m.130956 type:complete len:309 (+) Transcript_55158:413-1339(+)